jgi:regulator of replication initiation timing
MSLRIDPVLWFKHHALNNGDEQRLEKLYEIGSRYVEKVKSEREHYPKVENEENIKRIPITDSKRNSWCNKDRQGIDCPSNSPCKYDHYIWCDGENYGLNGECDKIVKVTGYNTKHIHFSEMIKENEKPVYHCRFRRTNLNRQNVACGFNIDPNFWIYKKKVIKPSCYPYFIVFSRSNAIPVITITSIKHCLNEEYVQTSDAWQGVLQTLIYMKEKLELDNLPLNRIYINFGKWMQQKADDPSHRSCHAHINIVLPRETIDKINQPYESKDKDIKIKKRFPSIVGSILPPTFHRLDDSWELIKYMDHHMISLLFKQNRKLKRTISTLKVELDKLKLENESLKQWMSPQIRDGEETDETPCSVDSAEPGTGINNQTCAEEFSPAYDE